MNRIEEDAAYRVKMLFQIIILILCFWQCFSALVNGTMTQAFDKFVLSRNHKWRTIILPNNSDFRKKRTDAKFVTEVLFNCFLNVVLLYYWWWQCNFCCSSFGFVYVF